MTQPGQLQFWGSVGAVFSSGYTQGTWKASVQVVQASRGPPRLHTRHKPWHTLSSPLRSASWSTPSGASWEEEEEEEVGEGSGLGGAGGGEGRLPPRGV